MRLRPPVKTHGGKYYLCDWIISHFPSNYSSLSYFEPFCGGASVFLNKLPSERETISDIDPGTSSIFLILRDRSDLFIDSLSQIEYTKESFNKAFNEPLNQFEYAINEFVLRRMSRGGLRKAFAWSKRLRGGIPGDVNAWRTTLKALPIISRRLQGVEILNEDASNVIEANANEDCFFYLDPPYLSSTRTAKVAYLFEMNSKKHKKILDLICNINSKVLISGYESPLYESYLSGWNKIKREIKNHSSQSRIKSKRVECLWKNF